MGVLAAYLPKWHLKLSLGKTVTAALYVNNREARRELDMFNNKCLEFQAAPKYLGVHMDWMLSFKHHLEEVKAKVSSRVALIHHLAGAKSWSSLQLSTVRLYGIEVPT